MNNTQLLNLVIQKFSLTFLDPEMNSIASDYFMDLGGCELMARHVRDGRVTRELVVTYRHLAFDGTGVGAGGSSTGGGRGYGPGSGKGNGYRSGFGRGTGSGAGNGDGRHRSSVVDRKPSVHVIILEP